MIYHFSGGVVMFRVKVTNVLSLAGFILLCLIFERTNMVISFLKISFSNCSLRFTGWLDVDTITFINYVLISAFPLPWKIVFFSTVTWLRMVVARINQFLVVWSDNSSHILCAAVAYLQVIPIGNLMKLVQMWRVHI